MDTNDKTKIKLKFDWAQTNNKKRAYEKQNNGGLKTQKTAKTDMKKVKKNDHKKHQKRCMKNNTKV